MGDDVFNYLEFGIVNYDYMYIKGENKTDSYRSVIFFANPLSC